MYNYQANDALYKGFTCQYCGKAFRNRSGLSRHIQFKHGITAQKKGKKEMEFELNKKDVMPNLLLWKAALKPSEFEYKDVVH